MSDYWTAFGVLLLTANVPLLAIAATHLWIGDGYARVLDAYGNLDEMSRRLKQAERRERFAKTGLIAPLGIIASAFILHVTVWPLFAAITAFMEMRNTWKYRKVTMADFLSGKRKDEK